MTDLRQAAEMALECLEYHWDNPDSDLEDTPYVLEAKQALRQALAQPVDNVDMSEERVHKTEESINEPVCFLRETSWSYEIAPWDDPNGIPVYTAPPISDYHEGWEEGFKAATREHEPVAWMKPSGLVSPYKHGSYQIPLYTAPPKKEWVGLTDQEKYDVLEGATGDGGRVYYDTLFRCYEAKLKEKNGG
jgi:hypothetical protein